MFTPVFDKVGGVTFTVGDITVCNENGDEFNNIAVEDGGTGIIPANGVKVQKLNSGNDIDPGSVYSYSSANYHRRDTQPTSWGWRGNSTKKLAAGEALIVFNGQEDEIIFKLKSPLPETK